MGPSVKQWSLDRIGQFLLVSDNGGTVRLLEADTGKTSFNEHFESPAAVAVSPGGEFFAVGMQSGSVSVFDRKNGRSLLQSKLPASVNGVEFSRDGRSLVVSCSDRSARILEPMLKERMTSFTHEADINVVHFSPDGSNIATGTKDGTLSLFASKGGAAVWQLRAGGGISGIAFTSDGKFLATANSDHSIRLIETAKGREVRSIEFNEQAKYLEFSPDARLIAAADGLHNTRVFEAATGAEIVRAASPGIANASIRFSSDSALVAVAHSDYLEVFRSGDSEMAGIQDSYDLYGPAQLSPSEKFLAMPRPGGVLQMLAIGDGRPHELWKADIGSPFLWCAFSADERYAVIGDMQARATMIELKTGHQVLQLQELVYSQDANVQAVPALSGDGAYLATGTWDRHAQVFDTKTRLEVFRAGYGVPASAVALSNDGKLLAVGSDRVRIYDLASKRLMRRLETGNVGTLASRLGHATASFTWYTALAFSPDSRVLAVAQADKTVRLYSVDTGDELLKIHHKGTIYGLRFNSEGRRLIVTEGVKRLIAHPLDPEELVKEVCSRLTRNLTDREWSQYVRNEPYRKTCPSLP